MTKWPAAEFAIFVPRESKDAFLTAAPCPPITLLTDFGTRDAYVGRLKGVILSLNPEVNLVDLSHILIPPNPPLENW
jgi:hypothetical protein